MGAADKLELLRLLEEKHRRRARDDLNAYCQFIEIPGAPVNDDDPDCEEFYPTTVTPAKHHRLINDALMRVERGEIRRLMIFMPPGSAKSTYGTVTFPTWFMGRRPGRNAICTSYGSTLAAKFGRKCRQITRSPQFSQLFGAMLVADNRAANDWSLTNGSTYMAGGILAGITGNRADLLVIDDPLKGREAADSPTIREKAWEEYKSSLRTRLKPNGAITIIQCMTGDTPVLMADGTEKPLASVAPGDRVATYRNGVLSDAIVLNARSNGGDSVFRITTASGKVVRANARHPFLVEDRGELKWIRTRALTTAHRIVTLADGGASGKASNAAWTGAESQRSAGACACPTTRKRSGLLGIVRRALAGALASAQSSSIGTASRLTTTTGCLLSRAASALCAALTLESPGATRTTGSLSCALTTATPPGRFADCYATSATSPLDTLPLNEWHKPFSNTSDFTLDEIASIEPAGSEEVFDLQVEGTENFIANGLVSHNTRWHEDDISGRILPDNWTGQSGWITAKDGEQWYVICLQAECEVDDDPLGRERGQWLWTEWFSEEYWRQEKRTQGERNWSALYQQRPTPSEGGIFKRAWVKRYGTPAAVGQIILSIDTGNKPGELNDPSVIGVWRITREGDYQLLHVWRERVDFPTLKRTVKSAALTWSPDGILIEDKASGTQLIQELRNDPDFKFSVIPFDPTPHGDKVMRANDVSPVVESGRLFLPEEAAWLIDFEAELFAFPLATTKDQVDQMSQFLKWAHRNSAPLRAVGTGARTSTGAFDGGWSQVDESRGFGTVRSSTDFTGFD